MINGVSRIQKRNGTVIYNPTKSYIADDLVTGKNCKIASMVHIDRDVILGDKVNIQGLVYIPPKTRIGNDVFIAPQVGFSNDKYPLSNELKGVTVCDGAMIFLGAKIIGGITIGKNSIVGMGSVVTKSIPDNEVWYGNPARFVMTREEYDSKKIKNDSEIVV